jgi:hypothetical protein
MNCVDTQLVGRNGAPNMRAWRTAYRAKKYRALFNHPSFWVMLMKARAVMWLKKRYFSRPDGTVKIIARCPLLALSGHRSESPKSAFLIAIGVKRISKFTPPCPLMTHSGHPDCNDDWGKSEYGSLAVWRFSVFNLNRFGVIVGGLCFEICNGLGIANLASDLQTKFRLGVKVCRVAHASPTNQVVNLYSIVASVLNRQRLLAFAVLRRAISEFLVDQLRPLLAQAARGNAGRSRVE